MASQKTMSSLMYYAYTTSFRKGYRNFSWSTAHPTRFIPNIQFFPVVKRIVPIFTEWKYLVFNNYMLFLSKRYIMTFRYPFVKVAVCIHACNSSNICRYGHYHSLSNWWQWPLENLILMISLPRWHKNTG